MYAARRISRSLCGMAATNGWNLRLAFGSSGVRVDSKADDMTHDMRYYSTYATPYRLRKTLSLCNGLFSKYCTSQPKRKAADPFPLQLYLYSVVSVLGPFGPFSFGFKAKTRRFEACFGSSERYLVRSRRRKRES